MYFLKLKNFKPVLVFLLILLPFFVFANETENIDSQYYYLVEKYAPNLWFSLEEQYYPCDYSDFYYDENFNEISGNLAKEKYDKLDLEQKLENFKVFYKVSNISESEIVVQYWLFYVFNKFGDFGNQHYGDGESVFVFIDKNSEKINRIIASAHLGNETKIILANNELINPQFEHTNILVERGSHANTVDGNNNGIFEKDDLSNFYNSYSFYFFDWTLDDKERGIKIDSNDSRYKIEKLSKLENKLKGKEKLTKSESLGAVSFNLFGQTKYVSQIFEPIGLSGGKASDLSGVKLVSENPEIVRPITGEFVLEKSAPISNFLASTFNNLGSKVFDGLASGLNRLPNLFSSQTGYKEEIETETIRNPAESLSIFIASNGKIENKGQIAELKIPENQTNNGQQISDEEMIIFEKQINEIKEQVEIAKARIEVIKQQKENQNNIEMNKKENNQLEDKIIFAENSAKKEIVETSNIIKGTNSSVTFLPVAGPSVENNQEEEIEIETTIGSTPNNPSNSSEATFTFSSSQENPIFECKLDETNWSQCLSPKVISNLTEGNHNFQVRAKDNQENCDETPALFLWQVILPEPEPPPTPPAPSIPVFDAINSIQNSLNFNLSWQVENQELVEHYELGYKKDSQDWQNLANQSENIYLFNGTKDETTYKFRVRVIDKNGQTGNWSQEIEVKTSLAKNVVINEIAWMGTKANSFDEWIELYNNTSAAVNLGGWILKTDDGSPSITFPENISIGANGHFLLERTDNNTINDISADFIYTGALNNNPECEILYLYNSGNQLIDKTTCLENGNWPAGQNSPNKISIERIDSDLQGDDSNNWQNNKILVKNGKDKNDAIIYGTPKQANSHLKQGVSLENLPFSDFDEIILYKTNSPFFTLNDLIIPAGKKLTIEKGTVLRINKAKTITVQGVVLAQGISAEKIIFTSYYDSDYGGAGINDVTDYWRQIILTNNSSNTKFENCVFKYGGKNEGQSPNVVVVINSGNPEFKNVKFSNFITTAVKLENSSGTIENSEFYGTNPVSINSGSPILRGNYFEGGSVAMDIKDSAALIENNTFKNFSYSFGTIKVENGYPTFNNNVFQNNAVNGIYISGDAVNNWKLEPAVYTLSTFSVTNSIFEVSTGTIIKIFKVTSYLNPPNIKITGGSIKVGDLTGERVVFTSIFDDYYGGDTNNDGSVTIPDRENWGVGDTWENGNWNMVEINDAVDSFFKNIFVSCGGINGKGVVSLKNSNVTFDNVNFEYNFSGIHLTNSSTTISNSKFEKSGKSYSCVKEKNSNLEINNSTFKGNHIGLFIENIKPILSDLIFDSNTSYAAYFKNAINAPENCPDLSSVVFTNNLYDTYPASCVQL